MLAELQVKIESEVSKIGDINLLNLGICFLPRLPYFPDGINVVENKNGNYDLIFTERGRVTSEVIDLTPDEVDYRLLKIVVQTISSEKIEGTNEIEIQELIIHHEFDKMKQLVKKTKDKKYQYEIELLGKINPKYSKWYENEH